MCSQPFDKPRVAAKDSELIFSVGGALTFVLFAFGPERHRKTLLHTASISHSLALFVLGLASNQRQRPSALASLWSRCKAPASVARTSVLHCAACGGPDTGNNSHIRGVPVQALPRRTDCEALLKIFLLKSDGRR